MAEAARDPYEGIVLGGTGSTPEPPAKRRLSLKERLAKAALEIMGVRLDVAMLHRVEDVLEDVLKDAHVEERRKQNAYLQGRVEELEAKLEKLNAKVPQGRKRAKLDS